MKSTAVTNHLAPSRLRHPSPHRRRRDACATLDWNLDGWLTRSEPFRLKGSREPLTEHADWSGPVKLTGRGRRCRRVVEIYLARGPFGVSHVEPEARHRLEGLLGELRSGLFADKESIANLPWEPPEAAALQRWLEETGYAATLDEAQNLRVRLPSRGCDGDVRMERAAGRLRLSQQLGEWQQLSPVAQQAMLRLACRANEGCRLIRLVWLTEDSCHRCEAQVDLSGLPTGCSSEPFWPDLLHAAMQGFELTLRRLGMELAALADPANASVVKSLLAADGDRPRRPK